MTRTIAVMNHKGGSGKTTCSVNIAAGLARLGRRVLLVDTDFQANATRYVMDTNPEITIKEVFHGTPVQDAIHQTTETNLWILPSEMDFAAVEIEIISAVARESILKKILKPITSNYDYILIDAPPTLGTIPLNVLTAADEILIPINEPLALDGTAQLIKIIGRVKHNLNPDLTIGTIVLTMQDNRTNVAHFVEESARKKFQNAVANTTIPRNVKLAEAPLQGISIFQYAPESAGAIAYTKLVNELIAKWE